MIENEEQDVPLSRTRKKQQAKEIETLARQLAEMSDSRYAQLELSDDLRAEVELARSTKGRGSHKRQVKHLAGLLRKLDDELLALQAALGDVDQVALQERSLFHELEKLRDGLCAEKTFQDAFDQVVIRYPGIDRKTISRLARSVHQHSDKRASREIFKRLRDEAEKTPDDTE